MSVTVLYSRALFGVQSTEVMVEVSIMPGQSKFYISGMPKASVRQSEHRVRVAIDSSRFKFPYGRVTINLSPADTPKEGGRFDLAIAVGILVSSHQLKLNDLSAFEFYAELGLNGQLRSTGGIIPSAIACAEQKRIMIISNEDACAASLVGQLKIIASDCLIELIDRLCGNSPIHFYQRTISLPDSRKKQNQVDLQEVQGQERAKRALVIAAAGGHHLLMVGPPGVGKTMIARCMPDILPPISEEESLEVTSIYSVSKESHNLTGDNNHTPTIVYHRPFRAPHHTISAPALIGGGSIPAPGEISLAHRGVLFLDELTEFSRTILDCMRQSLESGWVQINRVQGQAVFPARFQLLAAMNPCPCGYLGDPVRECGVCTQAQIIRYQGRVSGPVLNRLDLQIEVQKESLVSTKPSAEWGMSSAEVCEHVSRCRQKQIDRQGVANAQLSVRQMKKFCLLSPKLDGYFQLTCEKLNFSRRSQHRTLVVARTIADLCHSEEIKQPHLIEALTYRYMDRVKQWSLPQG